MYYFYNVLALFFFQGEFLKIRDLIRWSLVSIFSSLQENSSFGPEKHALPLF